ncbi:TetR/AcrR family transcriptional regulator [Mycobacterium sp. URHB0044]|jgi:AcrR family transcriptional regulator|uniref:TetR/AcrR family transcriptional regulator n=1 Tax=Mycobacterium sp. URHB0044 TaxID=1380386 RepID=UPI00048DEB13|nr:TetR family transcriptional regulator [Mycobacterium sp. URHB0044]
MGVHPAADAILQTALQLVDREGCDALTIRALVRESGISNGSVYHHVGSLESLRALVADEAVKDWAAQFLHALDARGYAGAAEHDMHWSRAHPALAQLIESEGQRGRLGQGAKDFGIGLRVWLDTQHLAPAAPAHLVSALVIGPLIELRRIERITAKQASTADLQALEKAVIAGLAALVQGAAG